MAEQLEQIDDNDALRNVDSETSDDLSHSLEISLKSVKTLNIE